jgi:hypothetical protein
MRRHIATIAVSVAIPALLAAQSASNAGALKFGEPADLAQIDGNKIKGQPSRLAWSPDGSELYLQMLEGEFGKPNPKLSHHVITIASGDRKKVDAEPEWAPEYWTAKSGQSSPDSAAFKIELKSEAQTQNTVSTPMGGALARGGGVGPDGGTAGAGDALSAAYNRQTVPVNTMLLHGEIIGEFVNAVIVPGLTFGWGPKGSSMIAYAAHNTGRIVVMDRSGTKQEIAGSKDALLPAWSPDGMRLAWLQRDGKKKYQLKIASVN